jgi:tetratricopeptide (TPR) repeat protein
LTAPHHVRATGTELAKVPQVDPAPCVAAISAADDDRIISVCGELIDNDKTVKDDRVKALIARAAVFGRRDQIDRAIADYDSALRADASLADIYNARGELWRRKGDRPKALRDFGAAIKLKPDQQAARSNYKSLALELERLGAMMAVAGKPSFNCATARKPVQKAICADPDLANLDREINAVNSKVVRDATAESAMRRSAAPITIFRKPCANGWTICWRPSGAKARWDLVEASARAFRLESTPLRVTMAPTAMP